MPRKKQTPVDPKPEMAEQPTPVATKAAGPGGRPRKISSPEVFDARVDDYLAQCRESGEPVLLLGMCLHLGLYGKEALYEYGTYDGFSQSVKRARAFIEHEYEKRLNTNNNAAGSIFALKNFGWRDQQQLDVTSENKTTLAGTLEIPGLADRFAKLDK